MHFRHISAKIQPKILKFVHCKFLALRDNISIVGTRASWAPLSLRPWW